MRVLVTGGAGFIGSNFLRLSVTRYPDAQFMNLDALTYAANLANLADVEDAANYEFLRLDIADAQGVEAAVASFRPNTIVHFAAESHVDRSILGPAEFVRTNIEGTFNLLEAARQLAPDPPLFHHVSTDEVYGSLGPHGLFTEESRYEPSSPYSASKAASDHLVRAYHRTYGLPIKITNCSNNYGPYQFPEKLIPLAMVNALDRQPLPVYGTGENVRDWLYVTDHCEAIWSVIERGRVGETYNVGARSEARNIDLLNQLCHVIAEEIGVAVTELTRLITFVKDRPGHDARYAIDPSKIERECQWKPRETLASGLKKTVRWYLDHPEWLEQVRTGAYRTWVARNYAGR